MGDCENCGELLNLLASFADRVETEKTDELDNKELEIEQDYRTFKRHLILNKKEVDILYNFTNTWFQRQCICVYGDPDAYDRLVELVFSLLRLVIKQMSVFKHQMSDKQNGSPRKCDFGWFPDNSEDDFSCNEDYWTYNEIERLLILAAKAMMIGFILYVPIKLIQLKSMELTRTFRSIYSDFREHEIPITLLRNVDFFCRYQGLNLIKGLFECSELPMPIANAVISLACNVKMWLNLPHIYELFFPLRSAVLKFMCNLSEKEHKSKQLVPMEQVVLLSYCSLIISSPTNNCFLNEYLNEYIWNLVKEPLDSPILYDKDGLEFAYKYFTSTTLTIRISGITQINNHIASFNAATLPEDDANQIANNLASWFVGKDIINNIFGPNLHVEIIKLSQPILLFLAAEGKISRDDIDVMWQAAQLKHCSKQVYDILAPLVKFLEPILIVHLYELLYKLEPREHSEQSLYLASSLTKHIWISGANHQDMLRQEPVQHVVKGIKDGLPNICSPEVRKALSPCKRLKPMHISSSKKKRIDIIIDGPEKTDESEEMQEDKDHEEKNMEDVRRALHCDSEENRVAVESLKRAKSSSNEDIKGHEGKKQKSEMNTTDGDDKSNVVLPVAADTVEMSGFELSDEEDIHHIDNSRRGLHHHLHNDDDEEDENDLTESDEDAHHMSNLSSIMKKSRHDQQVPNLLINDVNDDTLSDDGSVSSRMSNKSEKNMADFDGEDAVCDDEIVQLASGHAVQSNIIAQRIAHLSFHNQYGNNESSLYYKHKPKSVRHIQDYKLMSRDITPLLRYYNLETIYSSGSTLLWDLVQDSNIELLSENIAYEAEKAMTTLLCYSSDLEVKMKFIEGCLENVEKNRSVVISLRLLPKIFTSYHQLHDSKRLQVKHLTLWAFEQHDMMMKFFSNLIVYAGNGYPSDLNTHLTNVQVRLHFLTHVFSHIGLPETIRLTIEELDTLWQCLVSSDIRTSDEFFTWVLRQIKSKDQHAFDTETLKHLYCHLMPTLPPETMTLISLTLLQQLCNMCRSRDYMKACGDKIALDHIWKVALRAINTDVSMSAIQNINNYYMSRHLEHENDLIEQCMRNIAEASYDIEATEELSLTCIQRALLLLKSHLDMFKRKYAYNIRLWALEGKNVTSHVISMDTHAVPINLTITYPSGQSGRLEKLNLELYSNEYVAELRAEVAMWCLDIVKDSNQQNASQPGPSKNDSVPNDWHIRMITQGQEIFHDFDEKTLAETGFKDGQTIGVSWSIRGKKKSDFLDSNHAPPLEDTPLYLLLLPENFNALFDTMHMLSRYKGTLGQTITRSQILSRRVWDILITLPTNRSLLDGFKKLQLCEKNELDLNTLLDPNSPQKLIYSLYIVESLIRSGHNKNTLDEKMKEMNLHTGDEWSEAFLQKGGLEHLFNIFISGKLQDGSEWQQDCLAHLLKLLCLLGTSLSESTSQKHIADKKSDKTKKGVDEVECNTVFRKSCLRKQFQQYQKHQNRRAYENQSVKPSDGYIDEIPPLNSVTEQLITLDNAMPRFTSILVEMAAPREITYYKTGFWGRGQVIHFAMKFLISWSKTCPQVCQTLFTSTNFSSWLCKLVLEDHDPAVRRETAEAVYRLCTTSKDGFLNLYLDLIKYFDKAERIKPQYNDHLHHLPEEGKEPYGPTSKDYFWLLRHLVENLQQTMKDATNDEIVSRISLNELANKVWVTLANREYIEKRHSNVEDYGLIGMLNLLTTTLKYEQFFKFSDVGAEALEKIFDFLFEVPDAKKRHVPKCKSHEAKLAAYDLLIELAKNCPDNFKRLHLKILQQHTPGLTTPYPWDYWPHDDCRSECGFVGLTNLGATCYMASCMQHLFMMPEARYSILNSVTDENTKHKDILIEIQKMFAYLLESERKTYNPKSFCKVYTMDHQPLNTGEQKDMAEFFIDLVSKLEEMTPDLKELVKSLFGGVITNNVVSLDCEHVSRTLEEFYTVRCQVADMRSLIESLNEVTVKDTLEGDNMYTCSQCGKKVRAEKRACFKRLPKILCFNTMRYTFNMITMLKEKVNTHFSFPMRLDMSYYLEKFLMPQQYIEEKEKARVLFEQTGQPIPNEFNDEETYEYELIGVTVHTGTADGGHYYSIVRDRSHQSRRDKWYLFNDAEVRPFDANNIPHECFGGEVTSKTYDSVTDKYMDLCFEKTNSAYMLFYEWIKVDKDNESLEGGSKDQLENYIYDDMPLVPDPKISLNPELENWIWQDNIQFLQEKNIFDHSYYSFVLQFCSQIPQTLDNTKEMTDMACRLCVTFVLETLIHSKEKQTMYNWVHLTTKLFDTSQNTCEWFLQHMTVDNWWPVKNLFKCPNQMVRQIYQRLCSHVMQRLRIGHAPLFLKRGFCDDDSEEDDSNGSDTEKLGCLSCVTSFLKVLLTLFESHAKLYWKHLTEFFNMFIEFNKAGEEETRFLLEIHAIHTMVNYYLVNKPIDLIDMISEEEDEDEMITLPNDRMRPTALEKLIIFVSGVIDKASKLGLDIPYSDYSVVAGKSFPFIVQQVKDNVNLSHTRHLIHILTKWNDNLGNQLVNVLVNTIHKHSSNPEGYQSFYKLLSSLMESQQYPNFMELILLRVWDMADVAPYSVLEWLSLQTSKNQSIANWVIDGMHLWIEKFLIANINQSVRSAAALLIANLVPNNYFRQNFHANSKNINQPHRAVTFNTYEKEILHKIYHGLLNTMKAARLYTDINMHGSVKLIHYISILNYCTISREEKLLCGPFIMDLWHLYHPKLAEPTVSVNMNKQFVLQFWHSILIDCSENVRIMLQHNAIIKNIAYNYILGECDDPDVVGYHRLMLPAYYGILRLMCEQSSLFTRELAKHKNILWAVKNLTIHQTSYHISTMDEIFKLLRLFVTPRPDYTEEQNEAMKQFNKEMLDVYLQALDPRVGWATFLPAIKSLVNSDDITHYFLLQNGFEMICNCFMLLHTMHHEAGGCHIYYDMLDSIQIMLNNIKYVRTLPKDSEITKSFKSFKEWPELLKKLITLLNSYNCPQMRNIVINILIELVYVMLPELLTTLVPLLYSYHTTPRDDTQFGPFFPQADHKIPLTVGKNTSRPLKPIMQMTVSRHQISASHGTNTEFDNALLSYYYPYHSFIDLLCTRAVEANIVTNNLIMLHTAIGFEGALLHFILFPKFWIRVFEQKLLSKELISVMLKSNFVHELVEYVLYHDQSILITDIAYKFLKILIPKLDSVIMNERNCKLMEAMVLSCDSKIKPGENMVHVRGTLRALSVFYTHSFIPSHLENKFSRLLEKLKLIEESCKDGARSKKRHPVTGRNDTKRVIPRVRHARKHRNKATNTVISMDKQKKSSTDRSVGNSSRDNNDQQSSRSESSEYDDDDAIDITVDEDEYNDYEMSAVIGLMDTDDDDDDNDEEEDDIDHGETNSNNGPGSASVITDRVSRRRRRIEEDEASDDEDAEEEEEIEDEEDDIEDGEVDIEQPAEIEDEDDEMTSITKRDDKKSYRRKNNDAGDDNNVDSNVRVTKSCSTGNDICAAICSNRNDENDIVVRRMLKDNPAITVEIKSVVHSKKDVNQKTSASSNCASNTTIIGCNSNSNNNNNNDAAVIKVAENVNNATRNERSNDNVVAVTTADVTIINNNVVDDFRKKTDGKNDEAIIKNTNNNVDDGSK